MKANGEDRISKYLSAGNRDMLFGELSEDFMKAMGALEILKGVPVPIGETQGGSIAVKAIVLDMARIIGGDPDFLYAKKYLAYIKYVAGDQAEPMLVAEGARLADEGDLLGACRLLRAALLVDPDSRAAMYLYGRVCKACYETASEASAEGETMQGLGASASASGAAEDAAGGAAADRSATEEFIGTFKAESMQTFEMLTIKHPEFAMGYYFLGYAYLNMGLYLKAKLTWDEFIRLSSSAADDESGLGAAQLEDLRHEVSGMLLDLEEPVEIELGCNKIMGGDFAGGRDALLRFREGRYENWWPLWYYLGVAEASLGNVGEAITDLKRVLTLSPSNTDVMDELAQLYEATGDTANAAKYRNKIALVNRNRMEEASL